MPAEGCWTACFNAEHDMEIYVDVTTRPALDGGHGQLPLTWTWMWSVWRDGRVEFLDEDEFAEHQVQLGLPAQADHPGPGRPATGW